MRVPAVLCGTFTLVLACDRPSANVRSTPFVSADAASIGPAHADSIGMSIDASDANVTDAMDALSGPPTIPLPVPGFGDAVVSLPLGSIGKRPLVLAVHGNYDRPEWQCGVFRPIVLDRAFILCPRGIAREDSPSTDDIRFTFANSESAMKELDAGIDALKARFPARVDDASILYIGFSLGAIVGVPWLLRDPARTPRAVMIEGAQDRFTFAAAKQFAKHGGKRVIFGCGQPACVTMSKNAASVLEKSGVESKVVFGAGVGHGYDGPVADAIAKELTWLVSDDARW